MARAQRPRWLVRSARAGMLNVSQKIARMNSVNNDTRRSPFRSK